MPNKKPVKKTTQRMTLAAAKKKATTASKATRSIYDGLIGAGTSAGKKLGPVSPTTYSRQLTSKEAKKVAAARLNKLAKVIAKPKNKNLNMKTSDLAYNVGLAKGWSKNSNSKAGSPNTKLMKSGRKG